MKSRKLSSISFTLLLLSLLIPMGAFAVSVRINNLTSYNMQFGPKDMKVVTAGTRVDWISRPQEIKSGQTGRYWYTVTLTHGVSGHSRVSIRYHFYSTNNKNQGFCNITTYKHIKPALDSKSGTVDCYGNIKLQEWGWQKGVYSITVKNKTH